MNRKALILVCSLLLIVATLTTGVLTGCAATTTTETSTTTLPATTTTKTVTSTVSGTGTAATTTVTAPAVTITSTQVITGTGGQVVTVTNTIAGPTVTVTSTAQGGLITVLNPTVENTMVAREPLSARLTTLAGKTVYIIDITWGGPDGARMVYDALEAWFKTNYPTTTIVRKTKKGSYGSDDPDLWKAVAAVGAGKVAAIVGISG